MIEDKFRQFLKVTSDPVAAAVLAVGAALVEAKPETMLTPKVAAKMLAVSVDTVYELCNSGVLRSRKIGRSTRILPSDLDDYRRNAA